MSLYFDSGANRSLSNLDAEGEEKFTDKQDTLVSGENIKTINGVSVLGEGNIEVGEGGTITVNQTYDPTSSYAQSGTAVYDALTNSMEAVSQNGTISNCITEIPQNLKLELSGTTLTVKSGSIITLAGSTYSTVTLNSDLTKTLYRSTNTKYLIFYQGGTIHSERMLREVTSGTTADMPATFSNEALFYNTDDKCIYHKGSGTTGVIWEGASYPLCVVEKTNDVWSIAKDSNGNDMIFNGACFVGHHAVVYPNVKRLRPNGFNTDGSLSSILSTTISLQIIEMYSNRNAILLDNTCGYYQEIDDLSQATNSSWWLWYVKNLNLAGVYNNNTFSGRTYSKFIDIALDSNNIVTNFTIQQPVRLATTEMLDKVQEQVDTKQDTLVSGTNIKTINGTTVLGSGNFTLADQSLSNLDSTGQMIVDSQNGTISNCIVEIPQNLKIEIDSSLGVVLKAGSVVTLDGSTYSTYTTTEDKTQVMPGQGRRVLFVQETSSHNIVGWGINNVVSGATDSLAGQVYHLWFDTTNKEIKAYTTDGNTVAYRCAYPLCIVDVDADNNISFAKDSHGNDMIFNGAGFMGHHAFVYPNVKALIPNGFSDDGSLKSVSTTTNTLIITELNRNATGIWIANDGVSTGYSELEELPPNPINYFSYYIKSQNRLMVYNGISWAQRNRTMAVGYSTVNNIVTDFTIRQPYEGARNLLTDELQANVTTLTGYDSTQTQTLKNINGVLQWVTD